MKVFILLALLGVASAAVHHAVNEELNADWAAYKTEHGKSYDRAEELTRRTVWEQNLKKIQHHNIRASLGEHTYTLGMNKYGDMTTTEFVETMNGYAMAEKVKKSKGRSFMAPLNMKVSAFVDWRAEGYVTSVKDQGQCGSCWAFSATGSLEGQTYRKTGKLISLSEQNLIDCSRPQGNDGCDGGRSDYAFNYIAQVGIERERDYPYTAQDDSCVYDPSKKAAEDTGFVDIPSADEAALVAASVGPISVAIDASRDTFQLYAGGVYNEPACSSTDLNHGVLAVGYGNDSRGGDYYIVKNSWGEGWGLGGYILMARNRDNQCGIATDACYPIV